MALLFVLLFVGGWLLFNGLAYTWNHRVYGYFVAGMTEVDVIERIKDERLQVDSRCADYACTFWGEKSDSPSADEGCYVFSNPYIAGGSLLTFLASLPFYQRYSYVYVITRGGKVTQVSNDWENLQAGCPMPWWY